MNATMLAKNRYEELRHDPEFETELLLIDINEAITHRMNVLGWRKADLAERLGVSRAFITKLLTGSQNTTIATLVRVANALGARINVEVLPRHIAEFIHDEYVDWDLPDDLISEGEVGGDEIATAA
jgi:transcriptional regulator with XRE-family HTH domain